jgi:hypothetical protein
VLTSFSIDSITERKLLGVFHTCIVNYRAHLAQRTDVFAETFADVSKVDLATIIKILRFGKTRLSLDSFVHACEDNDEMGRALWARFIAVEYDLLLLVKNVLYSPNPAAASVESQRAVANVLLLCGLLAPPGGEGI